MQANQSFNRITAPIAVSNAPLSRTPNKLELATASSMGNAPPTSQTNIKWPADEQKIVKVQYFNLMYRIIESNHQL